MSAKQEDEKDEGKAENPRVTQPEWTQVTSSCRDRGKAIVWEGSTLNPLHCQNGFGLLGILKDPLGRHKVVP